MTEHQQTSLDQELPGLQLAFFEVIWRTFPWIQSIWIKESKGQYQVFVQATAAQDQKEWDDFDYLAEEAFNAGEEHEIEHTTQHGPAVPRRRGYRELMSDEVFKRIAKEHAPWRLEQGR